MFKFTWHAYIYILMIYFLYVSLMYIVAWYIYMGVLYLLVRFVSFFSYDEWRRTSPAIGTRFPP